MPSPFPEGVHSAHSPIAQAGSQKAYIDVETHKASCLFFFHSPFSTTVARSTHVDSGMPFGEAM